MRTDLLVKGKSLTGSSDLTIFAPLKKGLVPSLEAVSYKTRTERLLRVLNGGRASSHEFSLQRPISDSVERVGRIHSVRVAVLEAESKVMLAVTFDGTWEAYIRILWQKVGTLLDVIFCNTQDYVLSTEGFDRWCAWIDRVQIETGFFYNTRGLTVGDVDYLRRQVVAHCEAESPATGALAAVRSRIVPAEEVAYSVGQTTTLNAVDTVRQGLQALTQLFRLSDLYLPDTPDGDVLLRAARDLLCEFRALVDDPDVFPEVIRPITQRFGRQLAWLNAQGRPAVTTPRATPQLEIPRIPKDDVQGGILAGYDDAERACLVLVAFSSRLAAGRFLEHLRPKIAKAEVVPEPGVHAQAGGALKQTGMGPFRNVAFTHEGLRVLGMTERELESWLPHEFREGMEARSSMLGDFRANHPRRWSLPRMNWKADGASSGVAMQMSAVHAIVQIRVAEGVLPAVQADEPGEPEELELWRPLIERVIGLPEATGDAEKGNKAAPAPRDGVRVLHVQTMRRRRNDGRVTEHFGFVDGDGQPQFVPTHSKAYPNQVPVGEVLLGYPNQADFAPRPRDQHDEARLDFLRNGTFMVVRKLRQDVARLDAVVRQAASDTGLDPRLILAKMMGRWQSGPSLVGSPELPSGVLPEPDTDFTFDEDPQGSGCPFHAHVRRVNPRSRPRRGEQPGARLPRILRRGMAYGPRPAEYPGGSSEAADDRADRGLMFIAYNASIAEQFEVVQSWIAGGNSSGGYSGCSDPFLGVPEPGQQRWFSFEADAPAKSGEAADGEKAGGADGKRVFHVKLDSGPGQFDEPAPFVRLEWGAYLFVPSLHTLDWLSRRALATPAFTAPWNVADGERAIQDLLARWGQEPGPDAIAAWKAAVEDTGSREQMLNASLWAAVRECHGGVLQTPYGVLVGSRELVREVLGDDSRFSVCGQRERMIRSRFEIYLGLDRGEEYQRLSEPINQAIGAISEEKAFEQAAAACDAALRAFIHGERAVGLATSGKRWELNLEAREVFDLVLQRLCQLWIGLPTTGGPLQPGSWRWDWNEGEPPIYPSHFTPPSRYFFQPQPGDDVRDFGERHGRSITAALEEFVAFHRHRGTVPNVPEQAEVAPLAKQIFDAMPASHADDAALARTLAGVLMGFLPTLDGSLRSVLHEWLRLQTFWSLRTEWAADTAPFGIEKARRILGAALCRALQFRPAPEIIWRTVRRDDDRVGGVGVKRGDIVVLGLISALHEGIANGDDDVHAMFGGDRAQDAHPTHACPGYKAAMGVLLGVFAALMDVSEVMRPSPASLAFTLEGALP